MVPDALATIDDGTPTYDDAVPTAELVDADVVLVFEDLSNPGMLTGKHFDGRGSDFANTSFDQAGFPPDLPI